MTATRLGDLIGARRKRIPLSSLHEVRWFGIRTRGGGAYARHRQDPAQVESTDLVEVRTGDFVYSHLNAQAGSLAIIPATLDRHHAGQSVLAFPLNRDLLNPDWLAHLLRLPELHQQIARFTGGTARPTIKVRDLLSLRLNLPTLTTQAETARLLDTAAEARQVARQLTNTARETRAAHIAHHLTSNPNRSKANLTDLLLSIFGGFQTYEPHEALTHIKSVSARAFTRTGDIDPARADERSTNSEPLARSHRLRAGSILVETRGGGEHQPLGRTAFVAGEPPDLTVAASAVRHLRPNPRRVLPRWLFYRLWLDHWTHLPEAFTDHSTVRNLNADYFTRRLEVPALSEQARQVAEIVEHDRHLATCELIEDLQAELLRSVRFDLLINALNL